MNHTTGPWEQQGTVIWAPKDNGESVVICGLTEPYPHFVEYRPLNPISQGWELQMSNARLIAAAPDMYSALKAVHRLLDGGMFPDAIHLSGEEADAIRDALAKAEGK